MPNIRIKDIPTTASATSSTDFIGIDGSANGTRKLNAFSPTFGGNVTVSGTTGVTATDLTLGTSGPSVKSTLSARAPRQGLVYDGSNNAPSISMSALGTKWTANFWVKWASDVQWPIMYGGGQFLGIRAGGTPFCAVELTSVTVPVGKWAMVTMVGDGTNTTPYINGVAGTAVADGANYGAPTTLGVAPAGSCLAEPLIYNRALSASEVVSLYESGAPAGADYPARSAGTTLNTVAWANNGAIPYTTFSSSGPTTFTAVKASGTGFANSGTADFWNIKKGDKVLVTGSVALNNGKTILPYVTLYNSATGAERATGVQLTSSGSFSVTLTANAADSVMVVFSTIGDADYTVSSISVKSLGLLLAPDAAQAGGGLVWYDTSGNAANITLPASGVNWNVPSSRYLGGNWTTSGNLTVSGTGSSSFAGRLDANQGLRVASAASFSGPTGKGIEVLYISTSDIGYVQSYDRDSSIYKLLNVEGSTLRLNSGSGGNVLIGTTIDGGQKLQVNGDIAVGTGNPFSLASTKFSFSSSTNYASMAISGGTGTGASIEIGDGSSRRAQIVGELDGSGTNGKMILRTFSSSAGNVATALTLDSSQNATFAGKVVTSSAIGATSADSSTTTIQAGQSSGVNSKILVRDSWNGSNNNNAFFAVQLGDGSTTSDALRIDYQKNATFAGIITTQSSGTGSGLVIKRNANPYVDFYDGGTSGTIRAEILADNDGVSGGNFKIQTRNNAGTMTLAATFDKAQNATLAGSITTSAPTGGAGAWELGVYTATAPTATGYVTIEIGGVQYKLLAST